jgi:hypothetical protein
MSKSSSTLVQVGWSIGIIHAGRSSSIAIYWGSTHILGLNVNNKAYIYPEHFQWPLRPVFYEAGIPYLASTRFGTEHL